MPLNLIRDEWIPALKNGKRVLIRPDQVADPEVSALAWQRSDFNLACLEFLIGLLSMACPPKDEAEWHAQLNSPDSNRLRESLWNFGDYFDLVSDGPCFLQDFEKFEKTAKEAEIKSVDMLFLDSAGGATALKNADLAVKRKRFSSLSLSDAAMALYTLQSFAPSGGAGNRTSVRGGGPLTTLVMLVDDHKAKLILWRMVYANVLLGKPLDPSQAKTALPWLRPTRTSEKNQTVTPDCTHEAEAYFGMPRRIRLVVGENNRVQGVVQKNYGTNYAFWDHPLSPYHRKGTDEQEWLPALTKPGRLSYKNWMGVTMSSGSGPDATSRLAKVVRACRNRVRMPDYELLVGGWAMDNMKPRDFTLDIVPAFPGLDEQGQDRVRQLVEAADVASNSLRKSLKTALRLDGSAGHVIVESFFHSTEEDFKRSVRSIINGSGEEVEEDWFDKLRKHSIDVFDESALSGLAKLGIAGIETRITARKKLLADLRKNVRKVMDLPLTNQKSQVG